jgi:hypothetical protein
MKHTIIIILKSTNKWLTLSSNKQKLFVDKEIDPIVKKDSKVNTLFF